MSVNVYGGHIPQYASAESGRWGLGTRNLPHKPSKSVHLDGMTDA